MATTCPECNAKYERLEVREDKNNAVGYAAGKPIYGKQYLCKDCTHRWSDTEK